MKSRWSRLLRADAAARNQQGSQDCGNPQVVIRTDFETLVLLLVKKFPSIAALGMSAPRRPAVCYRGATRKFTWIRTALLEERHSRFEPDAPIQGLT